MSGLKASGLITNKPGIERDVLAATLMAEPGVRYATVQERPSGGHKVTAYYGRYWYAGGE